MPRGTNFSVLEKGKVLGLKNGGLSGRQTESQLNRWKIVISNFFKNPKKYGPKKHAGRPYPIPLRNTRIIKRLATSKN